MIKSGKLKALAVTSATRSPLLPDVPSLSEAGVRDFEAVAWFGVLAPPATPRDIVKRLQEESLKALRSNSVTARFANDGAVGGGGPPEEFAAFIANQQKIWSDIVKRASIKPD
jgi:tripartite-type tricarboxylate transporter receptor subunit TctC